MNQNGFFQEGSPRVMFYMGLCAGMAAVLMVNTLFVYAGGDFKLKAAEKPTQVAANAGGNGAADAAPTALQPEPSGPVPAVKSSDHIRGSKNAKVMLIEYSDFECPFCARHHPVMKQLAADFPNDVAWVYRHFPLSFHPQATPSANASECASEQGKFWEFADKLIDNQSVLGQSTYERIASELRLNMTQFKSCLSSNKYQSRISTDASEGATAGVNGTPATFINGKLVSGAVPYESLKQMIQAELGQ